MKAVLQKRLPFTLMKQMVPMWNGYDDLKVKADIPVVWTIVVDDKNLNGCNNEIVLSHYSQQIKLHEGENIIEFTPTEKGTFIYTCWMGMLKNTITVE